MVFKWNLYRNRKSKNKMKEEDYLEFAEYFRFNYLPTEWEGHYIHIGQRNLKENWFKMSEIFDNWKNNWWSKHITKRTRRHD